VDFGGFVSRELDFAFEDDVHVHHIVFPLDDELIFLLFHERYVLGQFISCCWQHVFELDDISDQCFHGLNFFVGGPIFLEEAIFDLEELLVHHHFIDLTLHLAWLVIWMA